MATTATSQPPKLSPAVKAALGSLRRRIRRYIWFEGLWAALVWLGLAFWGTLAIDWFFEPRPLIRAIMLVAVGGALVWVLIRYIGQRAMVRLTDSSMATLLERRFATLEDSLLTSVTLSNKLAAETGYNPDMLAHTCREADQRLTGLAISDVFDPMPLLRKATLALCLAATIIGLAVSAPQTLALWADRTLMLGEKAWPRKIRLAAVGFVDGVAKVPEGADFNLVVQAFQGDTELAVVPDTVDLHYRIEGGPRKRHPMNQLGMGTPGSGVLQQYDYTFRGVLNSIKLDVVGGDARLNDLRILVVENPSLRPIELEYEYPAYMSRPKDRKSTVGAMAVPVGTRLTVHARANKPLTAVRIEYPGAEKQPLGPTELTAADLDTDGMGFSVPLQPLTVDTTLLFSLFDTDGLKSRETIPLALVAVPDEAPHVLARLSGIGAEITPQARLPLVDRVADDYGVARVWFDCQVEGQPAKQFVAADLPKHLPEHDMAGAAMEVSELNLRPEQKLRVTLRAADLCTLGKGPNVGNSETWTLDVVTPEELLLRLEKREIVLGQRLLATIQEVTETRDLLLRMDFAPPDEKAPVADPAAKPAAGVEPGEKPAAPEKLSPEMLASRRMERVLQAIQNCRKNAQETLGIVDEVDNLRQQMTNNRVDSEQRKERLGKRVAQPLRRVVDKMFPEFDVRLVGLQGMVTSLTKGPPQRDLARQEADDIILAMNEVYDNMAKLQEFNELVDQVRALIEKQDDLAKKTKKRHKDTVRDLLEE